ncbi:hypothetical protein ACP70R_033011 [Stipagrostis hirtigluma subsp. patula]
MESHTKRRCLRLQKSEEPKLTTVQNSKVPWCSNSVEMFMDVISRLTDDQKSIVDDIGFSSLLKLSCSSVPKDLCLWLIQHFETDSRTLRLPNGFTLQLKSSYAHKILGIPYGGKPIANKGTVESVRFFKSMLKYRGVTPTVHELFCFITSDLTGCQFAWTFMLLALASFLCPNTRNTASTRYFTAIVSVVSIKNHDWSSFAIDWLVSYVKKFNTKQDENAPIGGCLFILVICYLEFLSTSEFNMGLQCPRIGSWTSRIVHAFAFLDSNPDSNGKFGRLQMKHICCTPFNDVLEAETSCSLMLQDVNDVIRHNLPATSQESVMNVISLLSSNLEQSVSRSKLPQIYVSVRDVIRTLCYELSINSAGNQRNSTFLEETDSESDDIDDFSVHKIVQHRISGKNNEPLFSMEYLMKYFLHIPTPQVDDVVHCASIDFPALIATIQKHVIPSPDGFTSDFKTAKFEELLVNKFEMEEELTQYSEMKHKMPNLQSLYEDSLYDDSFSRKDHSDDLSVLYEKHMDLGIIKSLIPSVANDNLLQENVVHFVDQPSNLNKKNDSSQKVFQSLNERMAGSSQTSKICTVDPNFPNFDIFQDVFQDPKELKDSTTAVDFNDSIVKEFRMGFIKCSELIEEEHEFAAQRSNTKQSSYTPQVIYASDIENKFFNFLMTQIPKSAICPRFFENGKNWVDQRKLSLSMMNGGWIHFHVMDCFCKMLSCNQDLIAHVEGHIPQQYFEQSTADTLMKPMLDHKNYKKDFLEIVGFKIDQAGLLHILCYVNKQWVLVVVNFIQRRFDVLDPEHSLDQSKSTVHSVIYNFRTFFTMAFPNFTKFNIRDFDICYVNVPKHKFRYDSGVFVIQFMETFNGNCIQTFSNANIIALRAKFLFQLISSPHNHVKPELFSNFMKRYMN